MARRPLFWRPLALIGASIFFLCLLASFLSLSEARPPAQDGTPTPSIYLPLVLRNSTPATVYVVSSSVYTHTISSLYVVGEVINNTSGNVSSVRVTCVLRNAGGAVIRMEYAYTMIDVLAPGQKAPFKVRFYDYPDYASYDLTVTYHTTSQPARTGVSVLSSSTWSQCGLYTVGKEQSNAVSVQSSPSLMETPPPPPPTPPPALPESCLYTVGEVQNNTTGNVKRIEVVATYYDASGRVTNADYTYVLLDVLGPGQKGPFKVYADNRPYSSYVFSVQYWPTSDPPATNVPVLSSSTWSEDNWLYTVGEIQNNTGGNIQYVKVIITFYDSLGQVTNVGWDLTMLRVLGPGQKAPFEIWAASRPYDSYTFSVDYDTTTDTPPTGVSVLSSDSWSEYGSLYIIGEVQNNNVDNVGGVRIAVTYYDSEGNVTNATSAYVPVTIVTAGQKACFKGSTENRPYNSYNLAVDFWTTTSLPPNLQVLSVTPSGNLHLAGEIRNNDSTKTYSSVEAVGTLYDGTGKVLNCEYDYTSPSYLGPGSTAPYDIYFWSHTTGWTSYAVDATGYPPPPPTPTPVPP
jgi:hypothetical protein